MTEQKQLFKLCVELPEHWIEAVSNRFFEAGIAGVQIIDEKHPCQVITYIDDEKRARNEAGNLESYLASLNDIHASNESFSVKIESVPDQNWAHAWKAYFKPLTISENLVVKPTWETYDPKPGQVIVQIDPEMTFGTGNHDTTRLCLEEISSRVRPGIRFCDLGTGTGLLALAAAKLGAEHVVGVDIDPEAVETAKRNADLNNVEQTCDFYYGSADLIDGKFDMIVANINSDTLVRIAPDIADLQNPGGVLLLAGIIHERVEIVKNAYLSEGYSDIEARSLNEWTLLCAVKKEDRA